jgi:hypothetical protein
MSKKNGAEWLSVCVDCGRRLTTRGPELPGQCPGCKGWRWLCHLQNPTEKDKPSFVGGYKDTTPELCPPINGAVMSKAVVDKIDGTPTNNGVKHGRPLVAVPDDLIRQLSGEGLGSIRIAEVLKEKGIDISYKTVQRRLQGILI